MKNDNRGIILINKIKTLLSIILIVFLIINMLLYARDSVYYASIGLKIWFDKMVPTLFPFMVLSGLLIRNGYSEKIARLTYPLLGKIFKISYNGIYTIIMGFFCGFPMGASIIADNIMLGKISKEEGNYLLSFTNNIGPVFFLSFICINCPYLPIIPSFLIMYLVPFVYGIVLRYTKYRNIENREKNFPSKTGGVQTSFLEAFDESIQNAIDNITKLGGYMVFFNLLNLIPAIRYFNLSSSTKNLLGCLLEISGGVISLKETTALYPFLYIILPVGGLSCIAQTYSIIRIYQLRLCEYLLHKINQCIITAIIYIFVYVFCAS